MAYTKINWTEVTQSGIEKEDFAYFVDKKAAEKFEKHLVKFKDLIVLPVITDGVEWGE